MLETFRTRSERKKIAARLCAGISARAREPLFFREFEVADTIDGRFDLIALHAWPVLECLTDKGGAALAQALVDAIFTRFEEALREQGAGDMGMSRRLKNLAGAFYGRLGAYRKATDQTELAAAIMRNLYRENLSRVELAGTLASYISSARAEVSGSRLDRGQLSFGALPAPSGQAT
ncbi:MAG TPA: ubiquinol-cytochrome C chaperone family protein [Rhizomicrobium sp.]|jgi:cytochrome b pre-mRNA-processing protein 3